MTWKHLLHLLHVAYLIRVLLIEPSILLIRKAICLFNFGCWCGVMSFGRYPFNCFHVFLRMVRDIGQFLDNLIGDLLVKPAEAPVGPHSGQSRLPPVEVLEDFALGKSVPA